MHDLTAVSLGLKSWPQPTISGDPADVSTMAELVLDELGRPSAGPLVRNRDGGRLSTRAANAVVCELGAAAGIGPA